MCFILPTSQNNNNKYTASTAGKRCQQKQELRQQGISFDGDSSVEGLTNLLKSDEEVKKTVRVVYILSHYCASKFLLFYFKPRGEGTTVRSLDYQEVSSHGNVGMVRTGDWKHGYLRLGACECVLR